jgi:hypothetical protein
VVHHNFKDAVKRKCGFQFQSVDGIAFWQAPGTNHVTLFIGNELYRNLNSGFVRALKSASANLKTACHRRADGQREDKGAREFGSDKDRTTGTETTRLSWPLVRHVAMFAIAPTGGRKHTRVVTGSIHADARTDEMSHINKRPGFRPFVVAISATIVVGGYAKSPESRAAMPAASPAIGNVSDCEATGQMKVVLHQNESLKGDGRLIRMLDGQVQFDKTPKVAPALDGARANHDEPIIEK